MQNRHIPTQAECALLAIASALCIIATAFGHPTTIIALPIEGGMVALFLLAVMLRHFMEIMDTLQQRRIPTLRIAGRIVGTGALPGFPVALIPGRALALHIAQSLIVIVIAGLLTFVAVKRLEGLAARMLRSRRPSKPLIRLDQ